MSDQKPIDTVTYFMVIAEVDANYLLILVVES